MSTNRVNSSDDQCGECSTRTAVLRCVQCVDTFCFNCIVSIHATSETRSTHDALCLPPITMLVSTIASCCLNGLIPNGCAAEKRCPLPILAKILNNVASFPGDAKFRALRTSAPAVASVWSNPLLRFAMEVVGFHQRDQSDSREGKLSLAVEVILPAYVDLGQLRALADGIQSVIANPSAACQLDSPVARKALDSLLTPIADAVQQANPSRRHDPSPPGVVGASLDDTVDRTSALVSALDRAVKRVSAAFLGLSDPSDRPAAVPSTTAGPCASAASAPSELVSSSPAKDDALSPSFLLPTRWIPSDVTKWSVDIVSLLNQRCLEEPTNPTAIAITISATTLRLASCLYMLLWQLQTKVAARNHLADLKASEQGVASNAEASATHINSTTSTIDSGTVTRPTRAGQSSDSASGERVMNARDAALRRLLGVTPSASGEVTKTSVCIEKDFVRDGLITDILNFVPLLQTKAGALDNLLRVSSLSELPSDRKGLEDLYSSQGVEVLHCLRDEMSRLLVPGC